MVKLFRSPDAVDFSGLLSVYAEEQTGQALVSYLQWEFFTQPGDLLAVWEEDEQAVSALRLERYADGLLLEALATAPAHRRKGYAASLIRTILRELEPGTPVYAHVDKRNRASLRIHEACGFRLWKDFARFVDGTVSTWAVTLRCCAAPESH